MHQRLLISRSTVRFLRSTSLAHPVYNPSIVGMPPPLAKSCFNSDNEWPENPSPVAYNWDWLFPPTLPKWARRYMSSMSLKAKNQYRHNIPTELLEEEGIPPLVRRILSYHHAPQSELDEVEVARAQLAVAAHPSDTQSDAVRLAKVQVEMQILGRKYNAIVASKPREANWVKERIRVQGIVRKRYLRNLRANDYRRYVFACQQLGIRERYGEGHNPYRLTEKTSPMVPPNIATYIPK